MVDMQVPTLDVASDPGVGGDPGLDAQEARLSGVEIALVERLLDRIQQSYARFKLELVMYNIGCAVALAVVIYSAVRTVALDPQSLGTYVASGGLFAVTGWRITQFLRDDLRTINSVIDRVLARGGNR